MPYKYNNSLSGCTIQQIKYLTYHEKTASPFLVNVQKANRNDSSHDSPTKPLFTTFSHNMLVSKTLKKWQDHKKNYWNNNPTASTESDSVDVKKH
jgi:hypothetical protein